MPLFELISYNVLFVTTFDIGSPIASQFPPRCGGKPGFAFLDHSLGRDEIWVGVDGMEGKEDNGENWFICCVYERRQTLRCS